MNLRRPVKSHSVYIQSSESPREEVPGNSIEVCVRMRPLLEPFEDEVVWEIDHERKTIKAKIENLDLKSLNLSHPKYYSEFSGLQRFTFVRFSDNVEGPQSKTKDIYNKLFKKIVDSVVQGYNGTIFMYGQTTSGKTYTMLGTQKDPGVLPYSLRTIFQETPKINDLLVPGSTNLKICDDPEYGVTVKGLKRQEVMTFDDAIYLMSFGEEHRKYRETNINEQSSRSHTIYQVFIESYQQTDDAKKKRISCLVVTFPNINSFFKNLVDLAGSERLSDNGGITDLQLGETGHINKSLFLLTNVIKKLADGKTAHIPYRDSKLTRILSNALGGNSLTAVVCTISPALLNYAQTLSTLRFASRAKKVKNSPTENLVLEMADLKLKEEVKYLREKLARSESEIIKVNSINLQLENNLHTTKQEIKSLQKGMQELKTMVFQHSPRAQGDGDLSSGSLIDLMGGENLSLIKSKSNKKLNGVNILSQSGELFFGDQILSTLEQIITESSVGNNIPSIDNGTNPENVPPKEWSLQCLSAKQEYLSDLKSLQQAYASKLEEISYKFINKENYNILDAEIQVRSYVDTEINKIEGVQNKLSEAIKKMEPSPSNKPSIHKVEDPYAKEQPGQGGESPLISKGEPSANIKKFYDNMLQNMEKKYNEVCNLVTDSIKSKNLDISESNAKSGYGRFFEAVQTDDEQRYIKLDDNLKGEYLRGRIPLPRKLSEHHSTSLTKGTRRAASFYERIKPGLEGRSCSNFSDIHQNIAYLWGSGKDGRLGHGRYTNESSPVAIRDIRFSKIVCGYHNTFGISQDGLLYGWGRNENGELGVKINTNAPIPVNITPLNRITIVDVACGWQHCVVLSSNGRLYSWGCGDKGQLGHGDNIERLSPAEIRFFDKTKIRRIACGHSQSAAITSEGTLYTWGHNVDLRLMISNPKDFFIPTLTEFHKIRTQILNQEETEIVSLSMGATHLCLVTQSGKVYAAGRGNEGQLGKKLDKDMKNVVIYYTESENEEEIESTTSCALLEVEAFGSYNKAVMVACGEKFSLVLNEKHIIYSFGDNSDGCLGIECNEDDKNIYQPKLIEKLTDKKIISISAGPRHAACISDKGELYCWGFNYYDQLEVGNTEKNYHMPKRIDKFARQSTLSVSCGYFHTACITK